MIDPLEVARLKALGQKWCPGHKAAFPYANFSRASATKDGHAAICRLCAGARTKAYAEAQKIKNAAIAAEKAV